MPVHDTSSKVPKLDAQSRIKCLLSGARRARVGTSRDFSALMTQRERDVKTVKKYLVYLNRIDFIKNTVSTTLLLRKA